MLQNVWEFFTKHLKDIFYIIGILSAIIVGIVNIKLAYKNRRNALREHLYKEQLVFIYKLNLGFAELQSKLNTFKGTTEEKMEIHLNMDGIYKLIFTHTHIASDAVINGTRKFLDEATRYINIKNSDNLKEAHNGYVEEYRVMTTTLRTEVGLKSLSRENQNLLK